jgi:hypothetical protein
MKSYTELERAIALFVGKFEHVFETDWDFTRGCLKSIDEFIEPEGDFLNPVKFDEGDNWDSRRCLLSCYRDLVEVMLREGIPSAFDEEDLLPQDDEC